MDKLHFVIRQDMSRIDNAPCLARLLSSVLVWSCHANKLESCPLNGLVVSA